MPSWFLSIFEIALTAILIPIILGAINSRRWRSTRERVVATCREAIEMIAEPTTDEQREARKGVEMHFEMVPKVQTPKFTFAHVRSHFLETLPLYTPALTPRLAASVAEFQIVLMSTLDSYERIVNYAENAGAVSGRLEDVMEPAVEEEVRKLIVAYIAVVNSSNINESSAFGIKKEDFAEDMRRRLMQKFKMIVNQIFTHRGIDLPSTYM